MGSSASAGSAWRCCSHETHRVILVCSAEGGELSVSELNHNASNGRIVRVLFAGEHPEALERVRRLMVRCKPPHEVKCVSDIDALAEDQFLADKADVVLVHHRPESERNGDMYTQVVRQSGDVPIVALTDSYLPRIASHALQAGVQDVLALDQIRGETLSRSIRHAIERQRLLTELRFALASEKVLMEELDKKNKELVELSITDGLTGLYNHRFLQERFDFEFKRAKRYEMPLTCLLMDIDHFKAVNDTWGHQFGDRVLYEIADIIKVNSREVDICGRYGGEEFMIITSLGADGAMQFASKLHKSIENHVFSDGKNNIHVTVSIGVAEIQQEIRIKQDLIERADSALYWAKRDGRNIIRLWKEVEGSDIRALDNFSIEGLKTEFMRLSEEMRATYMESTNALVNAIDAKDHYTQEHSKNVSKYGVVLSRKLALSESEIEVIKYAGLLHDIGKIGISQEVLTKKGQLSDREFEILRKHPVIGANILKDVKFLEKEVPIVLHHHERYDGTGYPHGLKGREIPLGARIMAVVDAYDAMTTDREYRRKLSTDEAVRELIAGKDSQFAPEVVDCFVLLIEDAGEKGLLE